MPEPQGRLVTLVGFRSDGSIHSLLLDENDNLQITIPSPSLFFPIPTSSQLINLNLPAGSSTQQVMTVPTGQYWRLTGVSMQYTGTVATVTLIGWITTPTANMQLFAQNTVVSAQWYPIQCNVLLAPGWGVAIRVNNATLNDDLIANQFSERVY